MPYPGCCVVRASMALPPGRPRFWATCGVTFKFLHSATKSAVSYALSPPTVTCFVPGICSSITSAASRSGVPLARGGSKSCPGRRGYDINFLRLRIGGPTFRREESKIKNAQRNSASVFMATRSVRGRRYTTSVRSIGSVEAAAWRAAPVRVHHERWQDQVLDHH